MQMNKSLLLILLLALSQVASEVSAQNPRKAYGKEAASIIRQINSVTASRKSMTCDFEQISELSYLDEHAVSYGNMSYQAPDRLSWVYVKPYSYVFNINGNTITTKSGNTTNRVNTQADKNLRNITMLMRYFVSGKCLSNNRDFSTALYVSKKEWIAVLVPRKADYKKMFQRITLHFDKKTKFVSNIVMKQNGQDNITIKLYNYKAK